MKKLFSAIIVIAAASLSANAQGQQGSGYPIGQVPFTSVKLQQGTFWGQRLQAARDVTVPLAFSKCESEGRYKNFVQCQNPSPDYPPSGFSFDDTDVYKTIEGASYLLQTFPNKKLKLYIDSVLNFVGKAQEPDGYLYTPRTMNPWHPHSWAGEKRWVSEEVLSHELYNLGHMVDAACAHYQATGSRQFLDIAKRYADCVVREVGPRDGQACVVPGHQIAEMALARLYVLTGEKKYLDEAKFLLDYRGKTTIKNIYSQSHKPVIEQTEAWGHAVRAGYMYAGMADVAALTGDSAYLRAIDAITENIISKKYYITGGVGARHDGEAFGANYELPNLTAYNETCAAISMVYLFQRMFLLHGDSKYIDCLERTLYNGVISGMSMDGGRFFYPNPLSSDGKYKFNADGNTTRQPWFGCACCPSNLCRFIPSVPGYIYAVKGNSIYVNLFAGNTANIQVGGKEVQIEQQTSYPWEGDITIKILKNKADAFDMAIRVPGWLTSPVPSDLYRFSDNRGDNDVANGYYITVNGQTVQGKMEKGYFVIKKQWKKGDVINVHFDMPARTVMANDKVTDDRGCVAIERGPLVYCAEWADNKGTDIHHLLMPQNPLFDIEDNKTIENTECQIANSQAKRFSVTALKTNATEVSLNNDGIISQRQTTVTLIPYYAWNHRGAGKMDVWFANSLRGLDD